MKMCASLLVLLLMGLNSRAQAPALIGYYAGDGHDLYARGIGKMTHVIWCFLHLQGDSLQPLDKSQEKVIRRMVGFKREHPELKVLLSFGGWGGCATCSEVFSRNAGRRRFAKDVHALLKRTWTDGIDLDWEYPVVQGPPGHRSALEDRHHFTLLMRALREELGDRYEISFAAGGTDDCLLKGFEWDSIMPVVDRVHIMSYDLVHGYSTATGHHTPLYGTGEQQVSADHGVSLLRNAGVPSDRIVIGSAFYARLFHVPGGKRHGLFQPATFDHTLPYSAMDTTITPAKGWQWYRDEKARAPYAWNEGAGLFLTCDDPTSIAEKARYVRSQGLGGIMFWQLLDDRPKDGLLDVMHRELRSQ